ncbi:MAG: hypothetical protein GWP15_04060 [Nitrospirae bacterium]|nr:hypothetical protein [Nitrospirota bacterium]
MNNIGNSEGLFWDVSEVESFKTALGAKLMDVFQNNCGICHLQALLGESITRESSKDRAALILSIKNALDASDNLPTIHRGRIRILVNEALKDNSEEAEVNTGLSADEMADLGLFLPDDADSSRGFMVPQDGELNFDL